MNISKMAIEEKRLEQHQRRNLTLSQKIIIGATGGVAVGLSVVCASFVAPAFRKYCLPYVPATTEQIQNVFKFVPKSSATRHYHLLDVGSGDGRIVIAAAKYGLSSDGVELNPWLVYFSRLSALYNGVSGSTRFFRRDLWKFNFQPYNYVIIFGVDQMMNDLERKLLMEVNKNTKVIACRFPLPNLQPQDVIEDGVNTVWFYDLNNICKN